jgi:hypothetical protein
MVKFLSPFLTPAFAFEALIVLLVLLFIGKKYFAQLKVLKELGGQLERENEALKKAEEAIRVSRFEAQSPEGRVATLNNSLMAGTIIQKRVLLIEKNVSRLPETAVSRNVVQATEEARFWTGAFTFIGLCGTLLCLGAAVFYLMLIVGRSSSGANLSSGLKEVVSHMVAVFGGMGAAFLSTSGGVAATVILARKINEVEQNWENLRTRINEFSLLELEPLAESMRSNEKEINRLDAIVTRMDDIARGVATAFNATLAGISSLNASNVLLNDKMHEAAKTFGKATQTFATATNSLDGRLTALTESIERQGTAQIDWNQNTANVLTWLQESVKGALETFTHLDSLRADILQDMALVRAEMSDSLQGMQTLAQSVGGSSQQTLYQLRDQIDRGLLGIKDSIEEGTQSEEKLLKHFELILSQMGNYAAHVEDTLNKLPGALSSEPLFIVENDQSLVVSQLSEGLGHIKGELVGLRGDLGNSLGNALGSSITSAFKEAQKGTTSKVSEVGSKLDSLSGQLKTVSTSTQSLGNVQTTLSSLTSQMNTLDGQVKQINGAVNRLSRSFLMRIGGGGD